MLDQSLQEAGHGAEHDYRSGSPHLRHWRLYDRLTGLLHEQLESAAAAGLPMNVLEVGAGHGGYTEAALASGCSVTATEMSRPSVARLGERYGRNAKFAALFDPDGSLAVLGEQRFSLIMCVSVLHHIPDYVTFLTGPALGHLKTGGTLLSIQDPLWYPRMKRLDLGLTKVAYFSWRMTQRNYLQGARTRLRRLRCLDERNPLDMVEYHVVRSGVDEDAVVRALTPRFDRVSLIPYWSTQSGLWQGMGESIGRTNTFALVAKGFGG